jgi:RNA polymerase primary sigma factor
VTATTVRRRTRPTPTGVSSTDSLDQYFDEICREQLLSDCEEQTLAQRAREGDESAVQELVARNLRFVVSVAKRYQHRGLSLDDLIAEGNVGLLAAARRFDPDEGVRFITYAVWWVRQAILVALTKQTRVVRVPTSRLAKCAKLSKLRNTMRGELDREPSTKEIAARAGTTIDDVEEWRDLRTVEVSLDAPASEADARSLNEHLLVDDDADEPGGDDRARTNDVLHKALGSLMPREAAILRRYFGLDGEPEATLDALATEMRITRERVRQLRDRALGKLRHGRYSTALQSLNH